MDPGLSGAMALIDEEGLFFEVCSLPITINNQTKGWVKKRLDSTAMYNTLINWKDVYNIGCNLYGAIEDVKSFPTDGAASAFSFGDTYGAIKAVCSISGVEFTLVLPQVWKRHFMIGKDKEEARLKAIEVFPEAQDKLKRKMDHDRAEALLIAKYSQEALQN